jgi:hypothetical protein
MLWAPKVFTSLVLASFHIKPLIGGDAAEQHRIAARYLVGVEGITMLKVEVQDDGKAHEPCETREYPNQPRQSTDQGQTDRHAQATPDSCQHFENHPLLRRINDRGNCGQSAARLKVNARAEKYAVIG